MSSADVIVKSGLELTVKSSPEQETKDAGEDVKTGSAAAEETTTTEAEEKEKADWQCYDCGYGLCLLRYAVQLSPLHIMAVLWFMDISLDMMEKLFGSMVIICPLVLGAASGMASSVNYLELNDWYTMCSDETAANYNENLKKCLDEWYNDDNIINVRDVCAKPIKKFEDNIFTAHNLIAMALLLSVIAYLYSVAHLRKVDESDESEEDEDFAFDKSPFGEKIAWTFRKYFCCSAHLSKPRRRKVYAWRLLVLFAVAVFGLTLFGGGFYVVAFSDLSMFKFKLFRVEGGKCDSKTWKDTTGAVGSYGLLTWLLLSFLMGYLFGLPKAAAHICRVNVHDSAKNN